MPVVKIDLIEGRTNEDKQKLIKGISNSFEDIGIAKEKVHIIINEVNKENWGFKGLQATEWMGK
ncbi:hypothetical protein BVX95_00050 [archaeon D22]|nr:hypothetical protein BVX95_00050 [archaeon D22]